MKLDFCISRGKIHDLCFYPPCPEKKRKRWQTQRTVNFSTTFPILYHSLRVFWENINRSQSSNKKRKNMHLKSFQDVQKLRIVVFNIVVCRGGGIMMSGSRDETVSRAYSIVTGFDSPCEISFFFNKKED